MSEPFQDSRAEFLFAEESESVKCRFSKCRFSAEPRKVGPKYSSWGAASKIQRALGQHLRSVAVRE